MYKRIVLKLSGEALAGDFDDKNGLESLEKDLGHFHPPTVSRIVDEIQTVIRNGTQVSLVVGGGNFCRGVDSAGLIDRVKADNMGMLASVMNAVYLAESLRIKGTPTHILTPIIIGGMTEVFTRELAIGYLNMGHVVIFAAGTGLPFFSTDTIAAVRAGELSETLPPDKAVEACVLFAKNEKGVYDSDPRYNPDAKLLREVTYSRMIKDGLGVIDIAAMHLCNSHKIPSVVFDLRVSGSIVKACAGNDSIKDIGTQIIF